MSGFVGIGHNSPPSTVLRYKDCTCHTCERDIHHLGIMSHRAMHRRRQENCVITFSGGDTKRYKFSSVSDGGKNADN